MRRALVLAACLLWAAPAQAAVHDTAPDAEPPVTNRKVETIVRDGSTLYLGGDSSYVGRRTSLARLGADGASTGTFPRVTDGAVEALIEDGAGGWYVGGSFATIGGADVPRLAHVLTDGSVDAGFRPAPDGEVRALALSGGVLYAGGADGLALLDPADGNGLPGPEANGAVEELTALGGRVYVGGAFTEIGGQPRGRLAALDGTSLASWTAEVDGTVRAIAAAGSDVYIGGEFANVAGQSRTRLAALNATTGAVSAWAPTADRTVHDIVTDAFDVYVGGEFSTLSGSVEYGYGKLDRLTAAVEYLATDNAAAPVYSLALDDGKLYVGARTYQTWPIPLDVHETISAIDLATGDRVWSSLYAGGAVRALAIRGGDVFAGGSFESAGGAARSHLAAVDLDTGAPTAWNPSPNGPVSALALHDGKLYAGGSFTQIGATARGRLAAFDTATGALDSSFHPAADNGVGQVVAGDDGVFVSGTFANVGGQARNRLASLDPVTGQAVPGWNPAPNGAVMRLALGDGTLFAGGTFTSIGSASRLRLAGIDTTTGAATAFDAGLAGSWGDLPTVTALTATDDSVFVGGAFLTAGGQTRPDLAELDAETGDATSWFAGWSAPDEVNAIGVGRTRVWIAGRFDGFGSAPPLMLLEEHDRVTGGHYGFAPRNEGDIRAVDATGDQLHIAGDFGRIGSAPHKNLASWTPLPTVLASPRATGTTGVGDTLTCAPGTWEGEPTGFGYTWLRDGDEIATGAQHVIAPADAGAVLRCRVTARNRGGTAAALSAPAGSPDPPALTAPAPHIAGTVEYEQTVTCEDGGWSGSPTFSYRWMRDGAPIAITKAYTLTDADAGRELSCRVTAENAGGSVAADAAPVVVPDAPVVATNPAITRDGDDLTCGTGAWDGAPTAYAFRWIDADGDVLGTTSSFTITPAVEGTNLVCEVTARNAGGVTSVNATVWIPWPAPQNTVAPSISGDGVAGRTLTCHDGTWIGGGWLQQIRWLREDGSEVAQGRTWDPGTAEIGTDVRCEVSWFNGQFATALSAFVTIKAPPPPPPPPVDPPAPPAQDPPAAADPAAPAPEVRVAAQVVVHGGRATVARVTCTGACRATVTVVAARGGKRLARTTVTRSGDVRVKLKRLRRTTPVIVSVTIDGTTTRRKVTLKPR